MSNNAKNDDGIPGPEPHSALYFGETRDSWWNADFLALISRRLQLASTKTVLDVGCGLGHWSRLLLPLCHPDAHLVGIDREARWVREAAALCPAPSRCEFRQADIEALPFPDGSFGLVTCQTVLIHLADVRASLAEMERVLAPGGWLLLVEPNNLATRAASLLGDATLPLETAFAVLRLQAICERGKSALGLGNNSLGETVLSHLDRERFDHIQVWQDDRPFPLLPPYQDQTSQAAIREARSFLDRDIWIWPKEETRRYFAAGATADDLRSHAGATSEAFETAWATAMAVDRQRVDRMDRGELIECGGHLLYLVAARKRS